MRSRNARRRTTLRRPKIECLETRYVMSADPLGGAFGGAIEHHDVLPDADFWLTPMAESDVDATLRSIEQMLVGADALTGLTQVRNDYGFVGTGQTVAVIDSGIAYDHYALGSGFGSSYRVVGGWDFAENDANPYDDGPSGGHGTHVAGIIGADAGANSGVAPGVDLVALRVFDDAENGYFEWVQDALQWVHNNRNSFEYPITAVNLSLGADWNSASIPAWAMLESELAQLKAEVRATRNEAHESSLQLLKDEGLA